MSLRARVALQQGEKLLLERAEQLRPRLQTEPGLWGEYCEVLKSLAAIAPATAPEASGALLTTAELAGRLGLTPKTILKHKKAGRIRPAVSRGKLIRWAPGQTL